MVMWKKKGSQPSLQTNSWKQEYLPYAYGLQDDYFFLVQFIPSMLFSDDWIPSNSPFTTPCCFNIDIFHNNSSGYTYSSLFHIEVFAICVAIQSEFGCGNSNEWTFSRIAYSAGCSPLSFAYHFYSFQPCLRWRAKGHNCSFLPVGTK